MLTEKLLAIDPIIIGIYLAVSLLLGIFGSRLLGMNNSKEEDYYLAGRKMPGWLNGMSVAATALNSDVAPLYCGIAVVTGLSGCWFFLSRFGMALLLAAISKQKTALCAVFLFPLFMASWLPLNLVSLLFRTRVWKEIEHGKTVHPALPAASLRRVRSGISD